MKNTLILISLLFLFSCDKERSMAVETVTIKEGRQKSETETLCDREAYRVYRWHITESVESVSVLGDCPWDILTGNAHECIGWRNGMAVGFNYDSTSDLFELGPYFKKRGIVFHATDNRCQKPNHINLTGLQTVFVSSGGDFETHVNILEDLDREALYVESTDGQFFYYEQVFDEFERVRELGPRLSDGRKATQDLDFVRVLIIEE